MGWEFLSLPQGHDQGGKIPHPLSKAQDPRFLALEGPARWLCPSCSFALVGEEFEVGRDSVASPGYTALERQGIQALALHSSLLFTLLLPLIGEKQISSKSDPSPSGLESVELSMSWD